MSFRFYSQKQLQTIPRSNPSDMLKRQYLLKCSAILNLFLSTTCFRCLYLEICETKIFSWSNPVLFRLFAGVEQLETFFRLAEPLGNILVVLCQKHLLESTIKTIYTDMKVFTFQRLVQEMITKL